MLDSCWRASSSLFSESTLRATAAGEKSSMLSKVMSTLMLPSPVRAFGTEKAARGLIAFMRLSKLSTSTSRNLRSATGGSGSLGLPDRSDRTPITKGSCTFFSAPYNSTSYSICTRGARFLAMNFWLLVAMGTPWVGLRVAGAGELFDLMQTVGHEVADDVDEVLAHEPLRTADEQRCGVARFVAFDPFGHPVERADGVFARGDGAE